MSRFRLIALDVDGTLVNLQGHIASRTAWAVREARRRGIEVVICTGRPFSAGIQALSGELGLSVPAIVRNGISVQDVATGEVLLYRALLPEAVRPAIDAMLEAGTIPIIEEGPRHGERLYTLQEARTDPASMAITAGWSRHNSLQYVSPEALYEVAEPTWAGACGSLAATRQIHRVLLTLPEVRPHWSGQERPDLQHHVAGIEPAAASKAITLQLYAAERGISLEETMAVGDNFNDVDMLREVGWGVAMGHAPDAVKAVANVVVPDIDHDGCAVAIERYALEMQAEGEPAG